MSVFLGYYVAIQIQTTFIVALTNFCMNPKKNSTIGYLVEFFCVKVLLVFLSVKTVETLDPACTRA
jgi:hypothetical protein